MCTLYANKEYLLLYFDQYLHLCSLSYLQIYKHKVLPTPKHVIFRGSFISRMSIKFESGLDWANPFCACDRHKVIGRRRRDCDVMKLPMFLFPFIPSRVFIRRHTVIYWENSKLQYTLFKYRTEYGKYKRKRSLL